MNLSNSLARRLTERMLRWRNRVLGDPAFHRFALRFPLTAPVARHRAARLFDLVAGFTYTQTLAACLDCGMLEALADGPLDPTALADRTGLEPAAAERLVRAAAALDLADRVADRWMLGAQGAALRANPGIGEMVAHHRLLYADLAEPLALLRRGGGGGELQRYWHYAGVPGTGEPGTVDGYSALMSASQPLLAAQVIAAYPFARHRRVLDVGGGSGAFLAALGAQVPALDLALFDLPAVADLAARRFAGAESVRPITPVGGNFLRDPLPRGFDLITLVRIVHDHDDAPVMTLLRAVHAALPSGGRLLIAEPMAETRGARASGDAYFGLYLLAMGSGRPRRADELRTMLRDAGFARTREYPTVLPLTARVLVTERI